MRKTLMISSLLALGLGVAGAQSTTTAPAQVTLSDVPAGHWAKDAVDKIVSCGLIQGFPDGTFRGNENLTRYQAALIFHRLLTTDALSKCGFSQGDMTTIVNGMQEVSTELAAISTRVGDLEKANSDQEARIAALEAKIAALDSGAASTDVTALQDRVAALEEAIKNIPAGPAGPQGPAGPAGPQGPAGPAGSTTTGTVVTPPPVTTTPPTTTVVIGDVTPNVSSKNYYGGLSIGAKSSKDQCTNIINKSKPPVNYCVSAGGMIGAKNVFGPIGARISADYFPGYNAISADAAVTYNLDMGSLGLYAGLGAGVTSSASRTTTGSATDIYGLGLLGVEYHVTDSISAFVEGDGRYYFNSNKGYGTGLGTDTKGFNPAVKAGVKFYF